MEILDMRMIVKSLSFLDIFLAHVNGGNIRFGFLSDRFCKGPMPTTNIEHLLLGINTFTEVIMVFHKSMFRMDVSFIINSTSTGYTI